MRVQYLLRRLWPRVWHDRYAGIQSQLTASNESGIGTYKFSVHELPFLQDDQH